MACQRFCETFLHQILERAEHDERLVALVLAARGKPGNVDEVRQGVICDTGALISLRDDVTTNVAVMIGNIIVSGNRSKTKTAIVGVGAD